MRADHVEVSWDAAKSKWLIRIASGEEVIRRHCDVSKDADDQTLRSAAENHRGRRLRSGPHVHQHSSLASFQCVRSENRPKFQGFAAATNRKASSIVSRLPLEPSELVSIFEN